MLLQIVGARRWQRDTHYCVTAMTALRRYSCLGVVYRKASLFLCFSRAVSPQSSGRKLWRVFLLLLFCRPFRAWKEQKRNEYEYTNCARAVLLQCPELCSAIFPRCMLPRAREIWLKVPRGKRVIARTTPNERSCYLLPSCFSPFLCVCVCVCSSVCRLVCSVKNCEHTFFLKS